MIKKFNKYVKESQVQIDDPRKKNNRIGNFK